MKKKQTKTSKRNSFLSVLSATMLCAASLFHSCSEPEAVAPLSGDRQELVLSTNLLQTRATDTSFVPGDRIGLFAVELDGGGDDTLRPPSNDPANTNYKNNILYELTGDGTWTSDSIVLFPEHNRLDLYLYYPYTMTRLLFKPRIPNTTVSFRVQSDQSFYENYTLSDFSTAFKKNVASATQVQVDFYHRLSQVRLALKAGVGYTLDDLDSANVRLLSVGDQVEYNLGGGSAELPVLIPTSVADITPYGTWTKEGAKQTGLKAIVAPQKFYVNSQVEVEVNSRKYYANLSNASELKSGKSHLLTITVAKDGISLDEVILEDWNTGEEDILYGEEDQSKKAFITEWVTRNKAVSLPIEPVYKDFLGDYLEGGEYIDQAAKNEITIEWGDGCISTMHSYGTAGYSLDSLRHTYPKDSTYQIKISGICEGWSTFYRLASPNLQLTKVIQWGDVGFRTLNNAFSRCRALTDVAGGMPNVEDFEYVFFECYNLKTIPKDLLKGCNKAKSFGAMFYYSGLTSIPDSLFADCVNAEVFYGAFTDCSNLTEVPPHLFFNCDDVQDFGTIFADCTSLKMVPSGLFANCSGATSFQGVFWGCTSLTSVPEDLFVNCSNVRDFQGVFRDCISLKTIPQGIFANCLGATSFSRAFSGCTSLTGDLPIIGGKYLWEINGASGRSCFSGCTNLTGYNMIPLMWTL